MIMYNVSMGWAAGVGILFFLLAGWLLYRNRATGLRWWGTVPAICAVVLIGYGWHMSTQWPLEVNPSINPIFSEPIFIFGLLLMATAVLLFVKGGSLEAYVESQDVRGAVLRRESPLSKMLFPLSLLMAALGLRLISFAWAIFSFNAVGGAPPWEPITGRLGDRPEIENTFFGFLYLLPGIALLLLPLALLVARRQERHPLKFPLLVAISAMLAVTGVSFTAFSVLNDYTHTGMLRNVCVEPGPEVPVESPDCTKHEFR